MSEDKGWVKGKRKDSHFTQFCSTDGPCVQVSQEGVGHWVQFTPAEARAVGRWMVKWAEGVRRERRNRKARERRKARREQ